MTTRNRAKGVTLHGNCGFTLIELLVVIAILAGMPRQAIGATSLQSFLS